MERRAVMQGEGMVANAGVQSLGSSEVGWFPKLIQSLRKVKHKDKPQWLVAWLVCLVAWLADLAQWVEEQWRL